MKGFAAPPAGRGNLTWMQSQDCVRGGGLHPWAIFVSSLREEAVASGALAARGTNSNCKDRTCD